MTTPDFSPVDQFLAERVADGTLPGVSYAVLRGQALVAERCIGLADREAGTPVVRDTLFRAYSNTKLITSLAVLRLHDAGHFGLDEPVATWIPAFGHLRVLRPGAQRLDDTEPLATPITLRHLLTHTAGFSHGVFDPGTLLYEAYHARGVRRPDTTLAELMDILATLPLAFQPGTAWDYSAATDVLARVVEVASGQRFGDHLQQHLLGPLGMADTGFVLRPEQRPRFAALYGVPAGTPAAALATAPCSQRLDGVPYPGAYLEPRPRQSGAGGLFTSLPDTLAVLRALMPGVSPAVGATGTGGAAGGWLKPATVNALFTDQLPPQLCVQFVHTGPLPLFGWGLAGAVTRHAGSPWAVPGSEGALQWGGLAGTHWWLSRRAAGGQGLAIVLMTQRLMGHWQPFWFEVQRRVLAALA